MRFDEFVLRIPGDEFRLRFHEQLTVLAGVGPAERHALLASIVGALTGEAEGAALRATDHTGRPVELTAIGGQVRARYLDDVGGQPPTPIGWFAPDAKTLRDLLVVTADDLGVTDDAHRDEPAEVADARAALWVVDQERQAAVDARAAVEDALRSMGELDDRIRAAEADAARREYAAVVAELDRVRAEAAALEAGDEAAAADRELLAEAPGLHRLAAAWVDAADAADLARDAAADDEPVEEADLPWLATVPAEAPAHLGGLLQASAEAERPVAALRASLHDVATSAVDEPTDERVVALASVDQQVLWTAHERVAAARVDLDRERLRIGGIGSGPTSSLVEAMEEAHRRWEDADTVVQERRVLVIGGGALLALLAIPASGIVGPLFALLILLTVVGGVAALLGQPALVRSRAARAEKLALEPLGVATYLTFHMRRIDATLDPSGRERVELAEAELSLAERGWASLSGGMDHAEAAGLADAAKALAAEVQARQGAGRELAELRRVLEEERLPAAARAHQDLLDALAPFGVAAQDVAGVSPAVVAAVVSARVELGAAARRRGAVLEAEADETEAADLLDAVLVRLGYDDGVLPARFEAAGWAIERAGEREAARAAARAPELIEEDLARLGAEARRLRRPEFAGVTAADAGDPDVASLRGQRDALSASLAEHERAGADLERLSTRRAELAEALAEKEAALAAERGEHVEVARVRTALLAHLARAHHLGPMAEALPVLLDDPLALVPAECKWELMDMLRRLGEKTQVLYLTDDAFIGAWARRRAEVEDNIILLEPVE
jgi:hypothetical protein